MASREPRPSHCVECNRELLSSKSRGYNGKVPHKGHGVCRPCWQKERLAVTLDEDVMILFERMKDTGLTKKEILKMLRVYGKE